MGDNEIIKALEICGVDLDCKHCSFQGGRCVNKLINEALSLINRQKAEIERLNGCVKSEEEVRAIMKSQMMPMVNEIVNEQFDVAVKLARAEAIKEFAERLKAKFDPYDADYYCYAFVDDVAKEMGVD